MSTPVTIEDIYKLFQKSQEEFDRRMLKADRQAAEARAEAKAEADRRTAEFDRQLAEEKAAAAQRAAEFDRQLAEEKAAAAQRAAEFDRRLAEEKAAAAQRAAEAEARLARLEQTVERTSKAVDGLTTRWGRFVEELVTPAVVELFQGRGIDVKEVHSRVRTRRQGLAMEIDILAVDDTELVVVECKSRLTLDDVHDFLAKLTQFKAAFPHYHAYQVYAAVAGFKINAGVDRYAYQRGLFVLKPSGNTVTIINDHDFKPAIW